MLVTTPLVSVLIVSPTRLPGVLQIASNTLRFGSAGRVLDAGRAAEPGTVLSSGLSQLMSVVLPKSPDGAICASVWSCMNIASRYGLAPGLISYSEKVPKV